MTPQINAIDIRNIEIRAFPSHTHRLGDKRIAGFADGIDAIKQSVLHILSTERYAYAIYETNYGAELEQFIGQSFGYIEANISRVIRDALMQDDRIVDVVINSITQTELNAVDIEFTVVSNLGTFSEAIIING